METESGTFIVATGDPAPYPTPFAQAQTTNLWPKTGRGHYFNLHFSLFPSCWEVAELELTVHLIKRGNIFVCQSRRCSDAAPLPVWSVVITPATGDNCNSRGAAAALVTTSAIDIA